jgi:hypothetical protein
MRSASVAVARRFCLFVIALLTAAPAGQAQTSNEYQIKAAFLFHFLRFTTWPEATDRRADPECVGVLGEDPFGAVLDGVVRDETFHGRKLVIRRSRRASELVECRLVFVSRSEKDRLGDAFHELDAGQALTVGEVKDFTRVGGVLNFVIEGQKIRFEISPDAARKRGLRLSAQLIRLGSVTDKAGAGAEPLT